MPMAAVDSASWTVPEHVVEGGATNRFGATMAHVVAVHDAQLHVHGAPEAVWKTTESLAPVAATSQRQAPQRTRQLGAKRSVALRTGDRWGGRRRRRRSRHSCTRAYDIDRAHVRVRACVREWMRAHALQPSLSFPCTLARSVRARSAPVVTAAHSSWLAKWPAPTGLLLKDAQLVLVA